MDVNGPWRRWAWPVGIVAGALAIRLALFTGLQGTDDLFYSARAFELSQGRFSAGSDLFSSRVGYVAPIAFFYRLFGVHVACLVAISLASSLLLVLLAYRFGTGLYSEGVGRTAALFVALLPLDVFYATEAHADLPHAALSALALYLAWSAVQGTPGRRMLARALAAGFVLGAAHLVKESAFFYFLPMLPWWRARESRGRLAAVAGAFASVILVEMVVYSVARGDAFHRVHLAAAQLRGVPAMEDLGFGGRMAALAGFVANPFGPRFVFTGGFSWAALAGAAWAFSRDRARSGWIVLWAAGLALLTAFWPASIVPFRPAMDLHPRFFAGLAVPGALLAAKFFADVLLPRWRRSARVAASLLGVAAVACAVRLHQDSFRWRVGAEWAHGQLAGHPGATVVTDPRTMELLRFLAAYSPPYEIRAYAASDPAPAAGTLLLDNEPWVDAGERWDGVRPPAWWRAPVPPRQSVAERVIAPVARLRGPAPPPERTRLSVVTGSP